MLLGLLPFCRRDLRIKPSVFVYACHACPSDFAVAKTVADPLEFQEIMAVDERWRFLEVGHGTARVEGLSSESSVLLPEKWERGFKSLGFHFVKTRRWHHKFVSAFLLISYAQGRSPRRQTDMMHEPRRKYVTNLC